MTPRTELGALLSRCYAAVSTAAGNASDLDLLRPSGCAGWSAADLLVHLMADARRALVALATPHEGPADTDDVSYWQQDASADDGAVDPASQPHALHIRRLAVAYSRPVSIVREWDDTSAAAGRAAAAADPRGLIETQGCVLTVEDFVATLIVEATIHLMDLAVALPAARPPAEGVDVTAQTMLALIGVASTAGWEPFEIIEVVTGRRPITEADRASLGEAADKLPLRL